MSLEKLVENRLRGRYDKSVAQLENVSLSTASFEILCEAAVAYWRCKQNGKKQDARSCYRLLAERAISGEPLGPSQTRDFLTFNMNCLLRLPDPRPSVAILCFRGTFPWDPTRPAGAGSEEAVIFAGKELGRRGYRVVVFASPPPDSLHRLPAADVRYCDEGEFERYPGKFSAVICWRSCRQGEARAKSSQVFFWPHDHPTEDYRTEGLSGVFFLSRWQRERYLERCPAMGKIPFVVSGNGCQISSSLSRACTNPRSLVYASSYARGLPRLLDLWPRLVSRFPQATLDICYGRETFGVLSEEEVGKIGEKIASLAGKGVRERGKLSYSALEETMLRSSLWVYPYSGPAETFCITAVRAQLCGLLPVTTREAALAETVSPAAYTVEKYEDKAFEDLLFSALERADSLEKEREECRRFAERFTWKAVVDSWETLLR